MATGEPSRDWGCDVRLIWTPAASQAVWVMPEQSYEPGSVAPNS